MCSTPSRCDVVDAGGDQRGAKLTACWAEPHWRSTVVAGRLDRQAGLEPGVAADVEHLLAVLLDAARDDVLDLGRQSMPARSMTSV
jgi:hypothetical protein